MIYRRCFSLLKHQELAQEAVQEVFVELLRYQDRIKKIEFPSTLFFQMATQVSLRLIRKEQKLGHRLEESILEQIAAQEDVEDRVLLQDFLDRIFHKEKPSTRTMAVMFYVDRMTYAQIAEQIGLSVSGVRWRLNNFKKQLQQQEVSWYD